eukprot:gene14233-biopygen8710
MPRDVVVLTSAPRHPFPDRRPPVCSQPRQTGAWASVKNREQALPKGTSRAEAGQCVLQRCGWAAGPLCLGGDPGQKRADGTIRDARFTERQKSAGA